MKIKDIVIRNGDGSYEFTQNIEIRSPNGIIKLGPGVRMMPGVKMFGVDIVEILEMNIN